jgi:ABC-type lipoprotein release transport system permease subunit
VRRALRDLTYFWRQSLAVVLGAAVAAAVLTGALLTGDSVRGSLRDLTLERLGGIDFALVSPHFFREELAKDLVLRGAAARAAPAVALAGTALREGARASRIAIYGVDARFGELFGGDLSALAPQPGSGSLFPPLLLSQALARELRARPGDDVLLSFERPGEIPRETLLGDKKTDDVLASRRFTVARVLPGRGLGSFGLSARQSEPLSAFVPLAELQRAAEREGKVNALFATPPPGARSIAPRSALQLEDLGLRLVRGDDQTSLESSELFLDEAVAGTAESLARPLGATASRVLTYLATGMKAGGRLLPYSMVSGLSPAPAPLRDGEILLNRWAADDLQARPGEAVEMGYLAMAPAGGLVERRSSFRLRGVLEMSGLGADRTLTPAFPGIADAEDIRAWNPPFPVDLRVVRPQDERYWDEYGAAPKAFVTLATARRLWGTRFGSLTAVRFAGGDPARIEETLRRELPRRLPLEPFGLAFQAVKREGLAAAEGSTDFAGLFLAFSFFLILSAVLLAALLFSLAAERRASELGLLLAVGYPVRAVRRRLLTEGALLAGAGALLGLAGALGYAWLLLAGLRSWWLPAVGTSRLALHSTPSTWIAGWSASVLTVLLAIAWTTRRLARLPPAALLAGATAAPDSRGADRFLRRLAPLATGAALALALYAALSGEISSPALWLGIGACALASGLAFFTLWLRRRPRSPCATLPGMAGRNIAASPGRSVLAVALVACSSFVLVTVAANRRQDGGGLQEETGGFPLFAESAVPLPYDPATAAGRRELGLSEEDEAALRGVSIVSFRTVPGDDASCLNLYQPRQPQLLGISPGFGQSATLRLRGSRDAGAAWRLLTRAHPPDVIPALADANSATWILKVKVGEDIPLRDESGRALRLRLVGLLEGSFFQSEVLLSEESLLRHFPNRAQRSFFLLSAPPERQAGATRALEEGLGRYGFDVAATAARLAAFHAVESTYLATFQTLGGLGLILGTAGLGAALLRSLLERRGELAVLRAFGFPRWRIGGMVLAENALLLLLGVALGTLSGLLSVASRLAGNGALFPWGPLLGTLLTVVLAGLLSCLTATWSVMRAPLLPVLKEE